MVCYNREQRGVCLSRATQELPRTLGALRQSSFSEARLADRSVKDELRNNLICKMQRGEALFPGILGYEDTVVPQVVNAMLSRHNFILLGLRGQAKTRLIRLLTTLLDEATPYVEGCEIHDNPYQPICRRCRDLIADARRRHAHRLAEPRAALRGKAGDARRHHRRHDRRYRSHQGRAPRPGYLRRADRALRPAAARQPRHLRHQRTARPRRQDSGGPVQHHAGRRRAD